MRIKNVLDDNNISIMNYNVRLFNLYNWIPGNNVQEDIISFIKKESPDVISFQEYHPHIFFQLWYLVFLST